ncbi:hypothetical protein [Chitinibacter bivalviorum]|nr:hypothetical protein [Chitinibacter bivalviorum]
MSEARIIQVLSIQTLRYISDDQIADDTEVRWRVERATMRRLP